MGNQMQLESTGDSGGGMADFVKEHPDGTLLAAFATGAVIGLAISSAIAGAQPTTSTWRSRRLAEGLGERFMDSLDSILPASLAKTFGKS